MRFLVAICLVISCAACAGVDRPPLVRPGTPANITYGVVLEVREATIGNPNSGAGALTGAVLGGLLASEVGGGTKERVGMGIVGALIGGSIGSAAESGIRQGAGFEYFIQVPSKGNRVFSIGQRGEYPVAGPGDTIMIIHGRPVRLVPVRTNVNTQLVEY